MTIWWQIKATKEFFVKFHEMFGLKCLEAGMLLSAISRQQPSDPRILDPLDPSLFMFQLFLR